MIWWWGCGWPRQQQLCLVVAGKMEPYFFPSHICSDLSTLSRADGQSFAQLRDLLKEIHKYSRLKPNMQRKGKDKGVLQAIIAFTEGDT